MQLIKREERRLARVLVLSECASAFGSALSSLVIPLIAASTLQLGATHLSLLWAAAWVAWPFSIFVVRVTRKHRPALVAITSAGISSLVAVTLCATSAIGAVSLGILIAASVLNSFCNVAFKAAFPAVLRDAFPSGRIMRLNADLIAGAAGVQIAAPILAGVAVGSNVSQWAFLVDAVSYAFSCLVLAILPRSKHNPVIQTLSGFGLMREYRVILRVVGITSMMNFTLSGVSSLIPGVSVGAPGSFESYWAGVPFLGLALGGILGAFVTRRFDPSRTRLTRAVLLSAATTAPVSVLVVFATPGVSTLFPLLGLAALSFTSSMINILRSYRLATSPRPEEVSTVTAASQTVTNTASLAGALTSSLLVSFLPVTFSLLVLLAPAALLPIFLILRMPRWSATSKES